MNANSLIPGGPGTIAPLALRPREAAKALGISPRTLWSLTAPRGPIPVARVGTARLYPVDGLRRSLDARAAESASADAPGAEGGAR